MKITTYNPDGSINEVQEYHFQIPSFIKSFDPDISFLNITDDDMASFDSDDEEEKYILFNKFGFLLSYDISNYIDCIVKDSADEYKLEMLLHTNINEEQFHLYNRILNRLAKKFSKSIWRLQDIVSENTLSEEEISILDISIIVEVIIYRLRRMICRGNGGDPAQYFINQIHWLYYSLYHCYQRGVLPPKGLEVMRFLYPFANLRKGYKCDFCLLEKLISTLFFLGGKHRSILYRFLAIQHRLTTHSSSRMIAFGMMKEEFAIMDVDSSNCKVENALAQLEKEEVVVLLANCPVGEEIKLKFKKLFQDQYKLFCKSNGDFLKFSTGQEAIRYFKYTEVDRMIRNDWKDFYFVSLDKLKAKYDNCQVPTIEQFKIYPYILSVPFFYYYLLVEKCEVCKKYEFEGMLLDDLILRAIYVGSEEKSPLYEQMYRLNYLEKSANLILDDENLPTNVQKKDRNEEELLSILNGLNSEIVDALRSGIFRLPSSSLAVEYCLVWLEPLFKRHLNNSFDEETFRNKIRELLESDVFNKHLLDERKKKIINNNLNFKLLLNIVGMLSDLNKANDKNWVKRFLGPSLRDDLAFIWKQKGTSSFHKYVSGWNSPSSCVSVLTSEMKKKIQDTFYR